MYVSVCGPYFTYLNVNSVRNEVPELHSGPFNFKVNSSAANVYCKPGIDVSKYTVDVQNTAAVNPLCNEGQTTCYSSQHNKRNYCLLCCIFLRNVCFNKFIITKIIYLFINLYFKISIMVQSSWAMSCFSVYILGDLMEFC